MSQICPDGQGYYNFSRRECHEHLPKRENGDGHSTSERLLEAFNEHLARVLPSKPISDEDRSDTVITPAPYSLELPKQQFPGG